MVTIAKTSYALTANIAKVDVERRIVYGWASVIEEGGNPVVDSQGDVISEATLVDSAQRFMQEVRTGKAMHSGPRVADVVESMVFTKELQSALGIDLGRIGWMIAMKVNDAAVWKRVKDGDLGAFSIAGYGKRVEVE